jgi:hypothetical protein
MSRLAPRVAVVIALAAAAGCDRGAPDPGKAAPPRTSEAAIPGPSGKACSRTEDCGTNEVCWFDAAGCGAEVRGVCGRQDPPCVVSYPFCGCTGHTYYGCTRPPAAWSRRGACGDAGP